jgi:hypothetical protein
MRTDGVSTETHGHFGRDDVSFKSRIRTMTDAYGREKTKEGKMKKGRHDTTSSDDYWKMFNVTDLICALFARPFSLFQQ